MLQKFRLPNLWISLISNLVKLMLAKRSRYTVISPQWGHTFGQSLGLGSVEGWHPGSKVTQVWGQSNGLGGLWKAGIQVQRSLRCGDTPLDKGWGGQHPDSKVTKVWECTFGPSLGIFFETQARFESYIEVQRSLIWNIVCQNVAFHLRHLTRTYLRPHVSCVP